MEIENSAHANWQIGCGHLAIFFSQELVGISWKKIRKSGWGELKEEHHESKNKKLPANKKVLKSRKNISLFYLETLLNSLINLSKYFNNKLDINPRRPWRNGEKYLKQKGDRQRRKNLLTYGIQGNLMTYFFNNATLSINKTIEKWTRCWSFPFSKTDDIWITKNYKGIILATYIERSFVKIKTVFNLTDSDYTSIPGRSKGKQSRSNTIFRRFLQSIWFSSQRENRVDTTGIWSPQRN